VFNPRKVFDFVQNMFEEHCKVQGVQLYFKNLNHTFLELPVRDLRILMEPNQSVLEDFPPLLKGD
jgi:hypothetical protein